MKFVAAFIAVLFVAFCISLVMTYPFWWLWNECVVPAVSVTKPIESWSHAFGLMFFISAFCTRSSST